MYRTLDATLANAIVNQNPDVNEHIMMDAQVGPFDAQPYVDAPFSFILMDNRQDGGALFEWSSPNIWQGHSFFTKACRGKRAIHNGKAFIREMFTLWDAEEIWGQTPVNHRSALMFNRLIGAKTAGIGDHWATGEVQYFRFIKDEWMSRFG